MPPTSAALLKVILCEEVLDSPLDGLKAFLAGGKPVDFGVRFKPGDLTLGIPPSVSFDQKNSLL
jgi:hypothetical protein